MRDISDVVSSLFLWSVPINQQDSASRWKWAAQPTWLCEAATCRTEGRREFAAELEARRQGEADEEFKPVRRGWCLGGEGFRQELLEQIATQRGASHYGEELVESAEARAQRLIDQALHKKGWSVEELKARRKGDAFKVRLAGQLRAQTTVTAAWIAQHLHMGTRGHLTHLLYHRGKEAH